jgi:hypothetical protein
MKEWDMQRLFSIVLGSSLVAVFFICMAGCGKNPEGPPPTAAIPAEKPVGPAAPATCSDCISVTVDNFVRAESDRTFAGIAAQGGWAKFNNFRTPVPIDKQVVPRSNNDTLYSVGVFDLDAGPVTLTMPDAGKRFETLITFDEDHYVHGVYYGAGSHTLTKQQFGTRYACAAVRILVNMNDPKDADQVHALQDAVKVSQPGGPGTLDLPKWDQVSQAKIRDALTVLGDTLPDLRHAFGAKGEVDPIRHLIATATAWGGNPDRDALYLNIVPAKNDGTTIYRLRAVNVPVDGFWSVTVYNAKGYLEANKFNLYSLNNVNAKKSADGSIVMQFGGCDGQIPNCLPIMRGWNYMVRLYRPRSELLNGNWKFPEAQPVEAGAR